MGKLDKNSPKKMKLAATLVVVASAGRSRTPSSDLTSSEVTPKPSLILPTTTPPPTTRTFITTYLLFIPWYLAYQPLSYGFNKAVIERYISIGTSHAKYGAFCVATWAVCSTLRGLGRTQ